MSTIPPAPTVYCGFGGDALPSDAQLALDEGTIGYELVYAPQPGWSNLESSTVAAGMSAASIIFGQPAPEELDGARVRWIQLTSAGYSRFDRDEVRRDFRERAPPILLTNRSSVYADPCAEHLPPASSVQAQIPRSS